MTRSLPILALLLALWPHFAAAPTPRPPEQIRAPYRPLVNPRLVVRICRFETRGEKNPWDAVGGYSEFGPCQIKLDTAREATGFTGSNRDLIDELFERAHYYGQRVADYCYRKGWTTNYDVAYCWKGGPRGRSGNDISRRFARRIVHQWEVDRLKKLWQSDL